MAAPLMAKVRQIREETPLERKTRSKGNFGTCERQLPVVASRFEIPLFDSLTSYLTFFGFRNPFASEARARKEEVWLFDNYAYQPVNGLVKDSHTWQAEFPVAYFKKNTGKDLSKMVASVGDNIGLGHNDEEAEKTIARRLQPFADAIAPARYVKITLPTGKVQKLGPGGPNGISNQIVADLGRFKTGNMAVNSAIPSTLCPYGSMTTYFAGPEGWSVISGEHQFPPQFIFDGAFITCERVPLTGSYLIDIDDTIKITMTPSPMGILRSTFIDDPTPVASMPQLYAHINQILEPSWFYLSASPYNLYPFLHQFIHAQYPAGPIFLREASWMDLGGFLASLTRGTQAYKRKRIQKIHLCLPRRKMICIGDSTQSDAEAYGDICRQFPGWVKAVFIRKVTGVAEMDDSGKNEDERFEVAFRNVPRHIWRTFEEPKELFEAVERLKEEEAES